MRETVEGLKFFSMTMAVLSRYMRGTGRAENAMERGADSGMTGTGTWGNSWIMSGRVRELISMRTERSMRGHGSATGARGMGLARGRTGISTSACGGMTRGMGRARWSMLTEVYRKGSGSMMCSKDD